MFKLISLSSSMAIVLAFLVGIPQASNAQSPYKLVVHVPSVASAIPTSAKVTLVDSERPSNTSDSRLTGQDGYGWFAVVDVPANALKVSVRATGNTTSTSTIDPSATGEIWLNSAGESFLSEIEASRKLVINLVAKGSNLTGRSLLVTQGKKRTSIAFSKSGTKRWVSITVSPNATSVKFVLRKNGKNQKSYSVNPQNNARVWISDTFTGVRTSEAWANNRAVIHYHRADGNYTGWGLHVWSTKTGGGASKSTKWETPLAPLSATPDAWGVTFSVPLKANSKSLPFVLHKADQKDPNANNQLLKLSATKGEVWFESSFADQDGLIHYTIPVQSTVPASTYTSAIGPSPRLSSLLASQSIRGSFANDNIYFVMTDRYQNKDTSNDLGGLTGDSSVTGYQATNNAFFHGGDFAGLTDGCTTGNGIARIKDMGFSAIWVTPPFKQKYVQGSTAAYHGYWITDFTQIDPHLGTAQDFEDFVDCAHSQGIKVILDIVVNHTADVNYYTSNRYGFGPRREATTSEAEANIRKPDFLNNLDNYHNQGSVDDFGSKENIQNGDFFGLDDIYTEKPAVIEGFAQVYAKWVNDYSIDGFRIDTARHVDDAFFAQWWPRVLELTKAKKPELFAFGEVFDQNSDTLSAFVRDSTLPASLDFAFQSAAAAFAAGGSAKTLANTFDADDWYTTATTNAYNEVNFLGNHDMGRFGRMLISNGASESNLLASALLGYDTMYLSRGIPTVYAGDEVGMIGTGGDKEARQDLMATQVTDWQTQARIGSGSIGTASSLPTRNHPIQNRIRDLNQLRTTYPVLKSGSQIARYSAGKVLVNSRIDLSDRREYVVAFNGSGASQTDLAIQTSSPNTQFKSIWGPTLTATSNANGVLTISIPAKGSLVLRAQSQLPAANSIPTPVLSANQEGGLAFWRPDVVIDGFKDPATCTFVLKVNDGDWKVVAVDDAATFRFALDGGKYANGAKFTLAAIVKSTSGAVAVSNAVQFTNNR